MRCCIYYETPLWSNDRVRKQAKHMYFAMASSPPCEVRKTERKRRSQEGKQTAPRPILTKLFWDNIGDEYETKKGCTKKTKIRTNKWWKRQEVNKRWARQKPTMKWLLELISWWRSAYVMDSKLERWWGWWARADWQCDLPIDDGAMEDSNVTRMCRGPRC